MAGINLKKNILMGGSFRAIIMIFSFFCSLITARYLGVELKGEYSYLVTVGGFLWMILDLGVYRSYPYLIRKYPDKIYNLFKWATLTFILEAIILSALGISLLKVWSKILDYNFKPEYMLLFIGYITLSKYFMQMQSIYLGMNKILIQSLGDILNSGLCLLFFLLAFIFIKNGDRLSVIFIATLMAVAIAIIYFLINSKPRTLPKGLNFKFITSAYSYGIRVFLSSIIIMLLIRVDIVLIKRMLGFREVGIYSIAAHIVDMLQVASNLVGGYLFVKLSDTEDDFTKWQLMKKIMMLFGAFLTVANLAFVLLGKLLLRILYGIDFVPAYGVYLWLIPASYGLSFGSFFNNYLNSKGFPPITILIPAISLGLNIGLNLLMIPRWGLIGAAIASGIAYLLWFFLIIIYEQRRTKGAMLPVLIPSKQDWKDFWEEGKATLNTALSHLHKK